MVSVVCCVITFLIGFIIASRLCRPRTIGTLRIDRSDDDGPYLFLELDKGVGSFEKEKYVNMRVKAENYLPRK